MRTIQDLIVSSKIQESPKSYSFKLWVQTANKLLDKVDATKSSNDFEEIYIASTRAITIIHEIAPKTTDFSPNDSVYIAAKNRVMICLQIAENAKKQIIFNNSKVDALKFITCSDLIALHFQKSFRDPNYTILIIDFRPMLEYLDCHLKWARHEKSLFDGIVNIEPDWITNSKSLTDIEHLVDGFNINSNERQIHLSSRKKANIIVLYDQKSSNSNSNPQLLLLSRFFRQDGFDPVILNGGFIEWFNFIGNYYKHEDFVESGHNISESVGNRISSLHPSPPKTAGKNLVVNGITRSGHSIGLSNPTPSINSDSAPKLTKLQEQIQKFNNMSVSSSENVINTIEKNRSISNSKDGLIRNPGDYVCFC